MVVDSSRSQITDRRWSPGHPSRNPNCLDRRAFNRFRSTSVLAPEVLIRSMGPARRVELELLNLREMRDLIGCSLEFLFGCRHSAMSRVFTIRGRSYQVCCDCGATREYSLETMRPRNSFAFHRRQPIALPNRRSDGDVAMRIVHKTSP